MSEQVVAPTLNEVAVVAGVARSLVRSAVNCGVINPEELSWVDALLLRIFTTVAPTRFPGDSARPSLDVGDTRASLASRIVRAAVANEALGADAQLVVTRQQARLQENLVHVMTYLSKDLSGLETAQVLPVGRWWADMHWRLGGDIGVT